MWKNLLDAKYQKKSLGDLRCVLRHNFTKAPSRSIIKTYDWFETKFKWIINNGKNLSISHSKCIGVNTLAESYPRLFALFINQDALVKDMWDASIHKWKFQTRQRLNDRKETLWQSLRLSLPVPEINKGSGKPW